MSNAIMAELHTTKLTDSQGILCSPERTVIKSPNEVLELGSETKILQLLLTERLQHCSPTTMFSAPLATQLWCQQSLLYFSGKLSLWNKLSTKREHSEQNKSGQTHRLLRRSCPNFLVQV